MLDIKFILENQKDVEEGLKKKGYTKNDLDINELIALYKDITKLKTSSQALAEEKNKISNSIKSANVEERQELINKSKALGEELKKEQEKLDAEQEKFKLLELKMPNMPSPDAPVGPDDSGNVVRRKVGEIPHFDFKPRDHIELMEINDWSEMERIAKISGSRTYAIKNDLAKLELAMHMMVLDKLRSHGFTVITVPSISKEKPLYGQGYLPFSRDEIYYMPEDDIYLSGTAELILNSLRADEILQENELPILYAGFSPCFRREAGAAGKDHRPHPGGRGPGGRGHCRADPGGDRGHPRQGPGPGGQGAGRHPGARPPGRRGAAGAAAVGRPNGGRQAGAGRQAGGAGRGL